MRILPLACLLLAACGSSTGKPQWPTSPCKTQLFEDSRFTVCDPRGSALQLVAAGTDEVPKRSFAEVMADLPADRVAFAMNAGMFDENGRPIGLAVVDGVRVHPINMRDGGGNFHLKPNGIFKVTNGKPSVRAVPPRHAADMIRRKSPRSTSCVGTVWMVAVGAIF